jgi:hypothetical protein
LLEGNERELELNPHKSVYRESEKPGERLAQPATAPKIDMPPLSFACD